MPLNNSIVKCTSIESELSRTHSVGNLNLNAQLLYCRLSTSNSISINRHKSLKWRVWVVDFKRRRWFIANFIRETSRAYFLKYFYSKIPNCEVVKCQQIISIHISISQKSITSLSLSLKNLPACGNVEWRRWKGNCCREII